ncbi:hypothetical protein EAO71_30385 [Streptomyces sp. ms191]|nr:hypothetical protein EAO71_30385 [Streptomyces sp. ms191]
MLEEAMRLEAAGHRILKLNTGNPAAFGFECPPAILEEGGASWDDVMMMRVYLTDVDHFAEMNEIYNAYFEEQGLKAPASARTTVYVGLPKGLLIEIDALAVLD